MAEESTLPDVTKLSDDEVVTTPVGKPTKALSSPSAPEKVKVKAKCKALPKAKSKALPKGKPKAKAKASKAGIDKNHILKQFEILHKPGRVLGLRFIKISPQRY